MGALEGIYGRISIHALCEEGDATSCWAAARPEKFLSTPSARRATHGVDGTKRQRNISIHALCEEGDVIQAIKGPWQTYFYPRPLRGGRLL